MVVVVFIAKRMAEQTYVLQVIVFKFEEAKVSLKEVAYICARRLNVKVGLRFPKSVFCCLAPKGPLTTMLMMDAQHCECTKSH